MALVVRITKAILLKILRYVKSENTSYVPVPVLGTWMLMPIALGVLSKLLVFLSDIVTCKYAPVPATVYAWKYMVEIHANEQIYYVPVEDVRAFIDDVNARRQLHRTG